MKHEISNTVWFSTDWLGRYGRCSWSSLSSVRIPTNTSLFYYFPLRFFTLFMWHKSACYFLLCLPLCTYAKTPRNAIVCLHFYSGVQSFTARPRLRVRDFHPSYDKFMLEPEETMCFTPFIYPTIVLLERWRHREENPSSSAHRFDIDKIAPGMGKLSAATYLRTAPGIFRRRSCRRSDRSDPWGRSDCAPWCVWSWTWCCPLCRRRWNLRGVEEWEKKWRIRWGCERLEQAYINQIMGKIWICWVSPWHVLNESSRRILQSVRQNFR